MDAMYRLVIGQTEGHGCYRLVQGETEGHGCYRLCPSVCPITNLYIASISFSLSLH